MGNAVKPKAVYDIGRLYLTSQFILSRRQQLFTTRSYLSSSGSVNRKNTARNQGSNFISTPPTMPPKEEPILFLWALSAWAGKVTAYLALRGIPYTRCEQPITQPRPDLDALGVNYRRIPVLSIGRDIYCDSLLILEKLEAIYGTDSSSKYKNISAKAKGGSDYALERLFEKWTDAVVFKAAAAVIPSSLDLMKDQQFQKDREELWGRSWGKAEQDALRPKGLADMRSNWDLLEATLGDGREWVLGTKEPMLADIHGAYSLPLPLLVCGIGVADVFM